MTREELAKYLAFEAMTGSKKQLNIDEMWSIIPEDDVTSIDNKKSWRKVASKVLALLEREKLVAGIEALKSIPYSTDNHLYIVSYVTWLTKELNKTTGGPNNEP